MQASPQAHQAKKESRARPPRTARLPMIPSVGDSRGFEALLEPVSGAVYDASAVSTGASPSAAVSASSSASSERYGVKLWRFAIVS